jgi:hypothetical protein
MEAIGRMESNGSLKRSSAREHRSATGIPEAQLISDFKLSGSLVGMAKLDARY